MRAALQQLERDLGAEAVTGADAERARQERRDAGAYFTPEPLARFVVAEAIGALVARAPIALDADGCPRIRVLDPAAGDGRFLAAAVAHLGAITTAPPALIASRCVVGIERDPEFAALARQRVPGVTVHCREAILDPPDLGPVDVVVGNPPYQRSIHFARSDRALWEALRGRYAATSHGEWDLYAVFLEQALDWVRPGGEVGLVVPSRWLTAAFANRLRAKLADSAAVRGIVDFGARQLFAGATTYASVAFLSAAPSTRVAVARHGDSGWDCGSVPAADLGAAPWRLSVGHTRQLLARLASQGPELGEVARIAKGTGTNADRVFVLEGARPARGDHIAWSRELDAEVTVESGLTCAVLRGRDVRSYGEIDQATRLLIPYVGRELIAPATLRARYPKAWGYLQACRERLEVREGGRFRGDRFYCFGRPQNLTFLFDPAPKVVVPDVARGGRALLDTEGAMVLDSAYCVRPLPGPNAPPVELLVAVLNTPIVDLWLRETGLRLRGDYIRLKTAYLRSLPLPPSRCWPAICAAERVEAGEAVRAAYEIDPALWSAASRSNRR